MVIGLSIAVISGLIGIYTEVILKEKIPFWVTQTWLYAFGALAAGATLSFWGGQLKFATMRVSTALSLNGITLYISVVAAVAGTGLVVANILRTGDNLVKIVGTSASIIVIVLTETLLFRSQTITMQTTAGVGIATISTWTYNYYKQTSSDIPANKDDSATHEAWGNKRGIMVPTRTKILFSGAIVAILTILTPLTFPTSLEVPSIHYTSPSPYTRDIERFFVPQNISPAKWAPGVNPPRCVFNYIKDHNITCNSPEVLNWERAYLDSGCPVFPIPDKGFIFHTYWRGAWGEAFDWTIESFLATQRLGDGHRMIFWYDEDDPPESTRNYFQHYSDYVEIRKIDLAAESKGTCLENMLEWTDPSYQWEVRMSVASFSDMVRTLLLSKYGGVWVDTDIIFLRDMTPLLRMGPSGVGTAHGRYNNDILVYGSADGGVGQKVLSIVCRMPANRTQFEKEWHMPFHRTDFGKEWHLNEKEMAWGLLYNDILLALCEDIGNCGLGLLPGGWIDGMADRDDGMAPLDTCGIANDFGNGNVPHNLKGLFTFHTRQDASNGCVSAGEKTLAAKLRKVMRGMIENGLDLRGRDVIPAALWIDK